MSSFTRLAAAVVFAAAAFAQPLALDACAVSCEASRAARTADIAPPCHHTTSCAVQIAQPAPPGAAPAAQPALPALVVFGVARPSTAAAVAWHVRATTGSPSPPTRTQLRV